MLSNSRLPPSPRADLHLSGGLAAAPACADAPRARAPTPTMPTATPPRTARRPMSWDGENRLLSVTISGGSDQLRLCAGRHAAEKGHVNRHHNLSRPRHRDHSDRRFYQIPGRGCGQGRHRREPVTTWLHRDHLNSIRMRTDSAGARIEAGFYWPLWRAGLHRGQPAAHHLETLYRRKIRRQHRALLSQRPLQRSLSRPLHLARLVGPDDARGRDEQICLCGK